jgi:hypothetical protein
MNLCHIKFCIIQWAQKVYAARKVYAATLVNGPRSQKNRTPKIIATQNASTLLFSVLKIEQKT